MKICLFVLLLTLLSCNSDDDCNRSISISGFVVDDGSAPVENAKVSQNDDNFTFSGSDGSYELNYSSPVAPPENSVIISEKDGYLRGNSAPFVSSEITGDGCSEVIIDNKDITMTKL